MNCLYITLFFSIVAKPLQEPGTFGTQIKVKEKMAKYGK